MRFSVIKLKLCPFCGSSASLQKDQFYRDPYYILCNGCLAKTEQVASAALAAADWNSRFTLELDILQEAIQEEIKNSGGNLVLEKALDKVGLND